MRLWIALAREAGWGHTLLLAGLALLSSLVEVAGLGLAVGVLLGAGGAAGLPLPALTLGLRELLGLLVALMAVRGLLQVVIAVLKEWLNSDLTDRLRSDLLSRVLYASSLRLEQVGRGELLGLLMEDIDTSVYALDGGLQLLQSLISLVIYAAGVVLAGRGQAAPLLLGLVAAALAGLAQRSGAWQLGELQTRLNAALQSIVGDGLHGLKAVRAAAAEPWLLQRFSSAARDYRRNARLSQRRQAVFGAMRDWLVVLVVALWLGVELSELASTMIAPPEITVSIVGEVVRPGQVQLKPNTPLVQAVMAAGGGVVQRAKTNRVDLIRVNRNGTLTRKAVALNLGAPPSPMLNPPLQDGDVVVVHRSNYARLTDAIDAVGRPLTGLATVLTLLRLAEDFSQDSSN